MSPKRAPKANGQHTEPTEVLNTTPIVSQDSCADGYTAIPATYRYGSVCSVGSVKPCAARVSVAEPTERVGQSSSEAEACDPIRVSVVALAAGFGLTERRAAPGRSYANGPRLHEQRFIIAASSTDLMVH